jgi:hypothetical protein
MLSSSISYAVIFGIHAITFAYAYPREKFQCYYSLKSYFEYFYILMFFISILFLAIDLLMNLKSCFMDRCQKFLLKDPFGIRVQQYTLLFLIPFSLFSFIFYIILVVFQFSEKEILLDGLYDPEYNSIAAFFYGFAALEYTSQIIYFVGSVLMFTILKTLNSMMAMKPTSIEKLDEMLENPNIFPLFKKFCEERWSLESILFYEDFKKFSSSSDGRKLSLATTIGEIYLSGISSSLELNVPGSLTGPYFDKINEARRNKEILSDEIFDGILGIVKSNLMEEFVIFLTTEEYFSAQEIQEIVE